MIDTSDDAIEADLERAMRGGPAALTWIAWAQVRATLAARTPADLPEPAGRPAFLGLPPEGTTPDIQVAQGPFGDSYAVPAAAAWEDRVTAAAMILRMEEPLLRAVLDPVEPDDVPDPAADVPSEPVDVQLEPILVGPGDADLELEIEVDQDIDADFFADERKARDR